MKALQARTKSICSGEPLIVSVFCGNSVIVQCDGAINVRDTAP